jgi:hypothetical protein
MTRRARKKAEGIIYAKLDTKLIGHPKMLAACSADPLAFELYVRALLWSKQNETDGVIPFAALGMMGFSGDSMAVARILVEAGLWEDDNSVHSAAFFVHDYDRYQRTQADVKRISRAGRTAAKARWDRESGGKRIAYESHTNRNAKSMPETETETETELNPNKPSSSNRSTPPRQLVDEVWQAYKRHHPAARFTTEGKGNRKALIERALRSHPAGELVAAIHGIHSSEYHVENGYASDLGLTLRDADHIEKYAAMTAPNGHAGNGESRLARAQRLAAEREATR